MPMPPFILAQDADDWGKIVFGVIFAIIWAISGVVSWINKKQEEARRERVRQEIERSARVPEPPPVPGAAESPYGPLRRGPVGEMGPRPGDRDIHEGFAYRHPEVGRVPAPPMPPRQAPPPRRVPAPARVQQRPQQQSQPGRRSKRRRQGQPAPPPIPSASIPTLELAESSPASTATSPGSALVTDQKTAAVLPAVDARTLRRWLNPQTLRSQYILTEILQPPLALRQERHLP
jgi:hypothetical protein